MGLRKPSSVSSDKLPSAAASKITSANSGVSADLNWKALGYVTSVKDQGACGGCWAFAATAALESYILIKDGSMSLDDNRAEEILLSCSSAGNCNGGTLMMRRIMLRIPACRRRPTFPFTASSTDDMCSRAKSGWLSNTRKIDSWYHVATTNPSIGVIKNALTTYGPLVTTMSVYYDFYSYRAAFTNIQRVALKVIMPSDRRFQG